MLLSGARSLMEKRPLSGLLPSRHCDRSVFSSFYTHTPAARSQPNGESIAIRVSEEAEENILRTEHWRSEASYDETTENSAEHG